MKTHTTKRAAAQTNLEDAREEAGGYEQPTAVRNIALRDGSQSIDYTEDDVEEYASTMYPTDEIAEDTCAEQLDTLREGGDAHTDTFTGFLEWLKSEDMLIIPPDPAIKYWAITGRLAGQDEDSGETFGPCTREEAIDAFIESQTDGENLEYIASRYGGDHTKPSSVVYINSTFSSTAPIE